MKLHLTDMAIKKLSNPAVGQVTHWDKLTPGFGLRCSSKSKSFVVMYGETRRLKTLGRYPSVSLAEARIEARRFSAQYKAGAFVTVEPSISFLEAKERFLVDCNARNKPRTVADYTRLLGRHFQFAGELTSVSRQQVMKVVSGLAGTPSEQSHAHVAIRTMMNWCVRHGLLEHSVVPPMKHNTKPRDRVLSEKELVEVYTRAREATYPFGPIVQLLILTGQRRTEIGSLRWSWLDNGWITFPDGFTKNKRMHRFPLSRSAQTLIATLPEQSDLIFPAATNVERPFSGWAWHKAQFDAALDGVDSYTLHDLRRTFATVHAKIGTPIHVTEKLLNHVSGTISGVSAVYNRHSYTEEMEAAISVYDEYLVKLMHD